MYCEKLSKLIQGNNLKFHCKQQLEVKLLQEKPINSYRKDVTAKLYGGDVTRKNKLLDKQKKEEKRMRQFGKVEIPQSAFINVFKTSGN